MRLISRERFFRSLPKKLLFTGLYLALVLGLSYLGMRCLILRVVGIHCPGCGMTRAFLALLRLDFSAAWGYHPMVFALPLMYLYFLFDGKFFSKKIDTAVWIIIGAGFLLHWLHLLLG